MWVELRVFGDSDIDADDKNKRKNITNTEVLDEQTDSMLIMYTILHFPK